MGKWTNYNLHVFMGLLTCQAIISKHQGPDGKWHHVFGMALAIDHLQGEVGKVRIAARKWLDHAGCRRFHRRCRPLSCHGTPGIQWSTGTRNDSERLGIKTRSLPQMHRVTEVHHGTASQNGKRSMAQPLETCPRTGETNIE